MFICFEFCLQTQLVISLFCEVIDPLILSCWNDQCNFFFYAVIIKFFTGSKNNRRGILLVGLCESGKTLVYSRVSWNLNLKPLVNRENENILSWVLFIELYLKSFCQKPPIFWENCIKLTFSGCPRKVYHRVMYIAPSSGHELLKLILPFKFILRRFEVAF